MEDEGVKFVTNAAVGKNVNPWDLMKDNDAVLLCTGSTRPRDLPIPGMHTYQLSLFYRDCPYFDSIKRVKKKRFLSLFLRFSGLAGLGIATFLVTVVIGFVA